MNFQLLQLGLPRIIRRNLEKEQYYNAFQEYGDNASTRAKGNIIFLELMESLHKRLGYLKGTVIIRLSVFIRQDGLSAPAVTNATRRQSIPAFR